MKNKPNKNGLKSAATDRALTHPESNQNEASPILPPQLLFMVVRHSDGCQLLKTSAASHCTCEPQTEFVSEAAFFAIVDGRQP